MSRVKTLSNVIIFYDILKTLCSSRVRTLQDCAAHPRRAAANRLLPVRHPEGEDAVLVREKAELQSFRFERLKRLPQLVLWQLREQ